jgi:hypothetical protein
MDYLEGPRVPGQLRHEVAAMWHTLRGNHGGAFAEHRATLERDPAHWSALFCVLDQLQREGRDAEALAEAERALEAEPSHFLALQTAACLSVRLGRHADGRRYVERGLAAMPAIPAGSTPMLDRAYLIASRVARLIRGRRTSNSQPEVPSVTTARYLDDWKEWAVGYLKWHQASVGFEDTSARE